MYVCMYVRMHACMLAQIARETKQNTDAMFKVMGKVHFTFVFCLYKTINN